MQVTRDLLDSLGCGDTPVLTVLNKCDLLDDSLLAQDFNSYIQISAKTGAGIDTLLKAIDDNLPVRMKRVTLLVPFANAGIISEIRDSATLLSEEYTAEGVLVEAVVDDILYARVRDFEKEPDNKKR